MVSALHLLKNLLLHLLLLMRVSVVHLLKHPLLHLEMSHIDSDIHRDNDNDNDRDLYRGTHSDSDINVDKDSVIVGHGSCSEKN